MSSIVACYLVGILVSNLRLWEVPQATVRQIAEASMLIGLPLLLLAIRLKESLRFARKMLFSFALCCLAGILCTTAVGWYLADQLPDSWKIAGMLTGLYTGGTPNVNAIGLALDAPPSYLVLVQAADVLLGGAYLLGLISFLPAFYSRFFPATPTVYEQPPLLEESTKIPPKESQWWSIIRYLLLALSITGASLALCYLFTGSLANATLIILLISSLGLLASNLSILQQWGDSYPIGEYFILIFCVALGLLADFRQLASEGMELLYFSALALSSTTLLHLLLCYYFKIDRDTVILSSVAAFYGPVFVVQVATAIQNKSLIAAGLAVSLLGFGIGNYLGIGVAYLVGYFSGAGF